MKEYNSLNWNHPWTKEVKGLGLETELTQTLHGICQFAKSTPEGYTSTLMIYNSSRYGFMQALLEHLKKNDHAKWGQKKLKKADLKLFLAHLRQRNYIEYIDTQRNGKVALASFRINARKIQQDYIDNTDFGNQLFGF